MRALVSAGIVLVVAALGVLAPAHAQRPGSGTSSPKARDTAPIDLTGYWVSDVTENWRYRMVTPAKGEYRRIPASPAALPIINAWDPVADERAGNQCKSYGAGTIMTVPGRLHITWQDADTLRIDTDAGKQTRLFRFTSPAAGKKQASPTWQGDSVARWEPVAAAGSTEQDPAYTAGGSLRVVTTNLRAGYLRKNGVPYSERATISEHFDVAPLPNGGTLLLVTSIVEDPVYLNAPYIVSPHFKKESDGSKWDPNTMLLDLVMRRCAVAFVIAVFGAGAALAQNEPAGPQNSTRPTPAVLPGQFELAASWAPLGTEDVQNDSVPVDYLGLALTDEGRARALSYDESQKSMIERQCQGWGATYAVLGPFGLRISSQSDPKTNRLVSYTIDAWEDWMEMTIWMDDRSRPSRSALHTQAGFTLGRWEGGALGARTTHLKAGFIRKTGVPLSDAATIDWRFFRHGDLLTVLVARDPVYLVEPEIISKSFRLSKNPLDFRDPCVPGYEGREPGDEVPHFAADQNPFLDEFMKLYNLPLEAVLGYRDTLYPEYRKTIKKTYVPPPPCSADCGVAGNFVRRRGPG